jgi:hypothetical protein
MIQSRWDWLGGGACRPINQIGSFDADLSLWADENFFLTENK